MADDLTSLAELAGEVAALRDLFQRRLLEDRSKTRLYDELFQQVAFARDGLMRGYLRPLLSELLQVMDRLPVEDVTGVRAELEEILSRRGVTRLPAAVFDPKLHEAVRVEQDLSRSKGMISSVLRDGFALGDEVLRPSLVVVSGGSCAASASASGEGSDG